jgi:5-methylcytosine-specific restriction protein B
VAGTEERRPQPNQGTGEGLRLEASLALIRGAAEERRFVSYGDVAAASGLPWDAARRRMDPHLFALCRRATERGWPLLSAIVVDKQSVPHGAMRGRPLIGFARAAERAGRIIGGDAAAFLAEEQQRVFAWAEKERGHVLYA